MRCSGWAGVVQSQGISSARRAWIRCLGRGRVAGGGGVGVSVLSVSSTIRSTRSARPDRVAAIDSAISGMSLVGVPVRSGGEEVRDRLPRGEVLNQRVEQCGLVSEHAVQRRAGDLGVRGSSTRPRLLISGFQAADSY